MAFTNLGEEVDPVVVSDDDGHIEDTQFQYDSNIIDDSDVPHSDDEETATSNT